MGYCILAEDAKQLFSNMVQQYDIYAPKLYKGEGCFSDIDVVRYGKIDSFEEIEWNKKSDYSFKEVLLPIQETMFYFTEDTTSVPSLPKKKVIVFLRSCDLEAVKRLDEIYMKNGAEDFYYARRRENVKFALMGCKNSCESGFCVSMETNQSDKYDFALKIEDGHYNIDCKDEQLLSFFEEAAHSKKEVMPDYVTENYEKVTLPKKLNIDSFKDEIWEEYGSRCIACGRCNFVCPTCTCFTAQDIFYQDNEKVGERKRVWASCQVDEFTDMAGNISFRKSHAERMRFKVMHKIYDYEKRFGYPMCVGCGRCDDVCPEYISYANLVNRLAEKETE